MTVVAQPDLFSPRALPPFGRWALFKLDAVEWLRSLPSESVDLILTDPAYESLEKHRAVGTTTRLKHSDASSNDWFPIFPNDRFPEFFRECFRVLKRDRHFYMFCDQETMFVTKPMAETAGFRFWKPLVWEKQTMGMGYHYRCQYEFVLFFEKGKRKLNNLGICDVLSAKRIRDGYPTQKPTDVSNILVEQSTAADEIVIDPFMGSGSFGVSALHHGRRFLGCDVAESAHRIAAERLDATYVQNDCRPPVETGGGSFVVATGTAADVERAIEAAGLTGRKKSK